MAGLRRLFIWGGIATVALAAVAVFSVSDQGTQRLGVAVSGLDRAAGDNEPTAARKVASRIAVEREARALVDKVKTLVADRDRLQARLDAIEQNVEGITGSIRRASEPAFDTRQFALLPPFAQVPDLTASEPIAGFLPVQPAPTIQATAAPPLGAPHPTVSPPATAAPTASKPATETAAIAPARQPVTQPSAAPTAPAPTVETPTTPVSPQQTRTAAAPPAAAQPQTPPRIDDEVIEYVGTPVPPARVTPMLYGVDVGTAHDMDGLRALWANAQATHGAVLRSLQPLIAVRENERTHSVELRLVAGPLTDATAAARVCATLRQQGMVCQPTIYDGQHLAMR